MAANPLRQEGELPMPASAPGGIWRPDPDQAAVPFCAQLTQRRDGAWSKSGRRTATRF